MPEQLSQWINVDGIGLSQIGISDKWFLNKLASLLAVANANSSDSIVDSAKLCFLNFYDKQEGTLVFSQKNKLYYCKVSTPSQNEIYKR